LAVFLAAFFFAAMVSYLLRLIPDPLMLLAGPDNFNERFAARIGLCAGDHEQHHLVFVVITDVMPSCQWDSNDEPSELPVLATREKHFSHLIVANHKRLESYVTQHAQPSCPREQTQDVTIVSDACIPRFVAQKDREVDLVVSVGSGSKTHCRNRNRLPCASVPP
jgi:hypothetical protein